MVRNKDGWKNLLNYKRPDYPTDFVVNTNEDLRILEINGIKYTYELFEALGKDGLAVGERFEVVKRDEDYITIKRLNDGQS